MILRISLISISICRRCNLIMDNSYITSLIVFKSSFRSTPSFYQSFTLSALSGTGSSFADVFFR